MAFEFLKDCTDPAELAERLRVLTGPDADAIDPGGALRREAATLAPATVAEQLGGGNG